MTRDNVNRRQKNNVTMKLDETNDLNYRDQNKETIKKVLSGIFFNNKK